jgi:serine/threonine protein kinase
VLQTICRSKKILPTTYELAGVRAVPGNSVACGGFCDAYRGTISEDVCIKQLRISTTGDRDMVKEVPCLLNIRLDRLPLTNPKLFCREAIVWKRLNHPNIVPFKGVILDSLQLISGWMPGGELREYIKGNQHVNLISLVGSFLFTST